MDLCGLFSLLIMMGCRLCDTHVSVKWLWRESVEALTQLLERYYDNGDTTSICTLLVKAPVSQKGDCDAASREALQVRVRTQTRGSVVTVNFVKIYFDAIDPTWMANRAE